MALKGHVEIELKDVNTGEVERIEGDNMITNVISELEKLLPLTTIHEISTGSYGYDQVFNSINSWLPLATITLGGLVIFDEELDENDPEEYRYCQNGHIIGYGSRGENLSNPFKGSYNTLESGKTETGYRHVWDFGTAQANGTIKSLGLTNIRAGLDVTLPQGMYGNYNLLNDLGFGKCMYNCRLRDWASDGLITLKYDKTTQELYYMNNRVVTNESEYTFTIYKRYVPLYSVSINETTETYGEPEVVLTVTVPDFLTYGWAGHGNVRLGFDVAHNLITVCISYGDQRADEPIGYFTIDTNSWTASSIQFVPDFGLDRRYVYDCMVFDGYLYFVYDTARNSIATKKIYKVNLSDVTDMTELFSGTVSGLRILGMYTNNSLHCMVDDSSYYGLIVYTDGTLSIKGSVSVGTSPSYIENPYWEDNLQYGSLVRHIRDDNYCMMGITNYYLGTKHNLPSPITKTAAQTMKVIYTLTDAGN